MEKGTAYLIECRTGCTCCASDNHTTGPWRTLEAAQASIAWFKETKRLASQYAPVGVYNLHERSYEKLPDGRLIIAGRLIADGFLEDNPHQEVELLSAGENLYAI